jgi:hypothetical protein
MTSYHTRLTIPTYLILFTPDSRGWTAAYDLGGILRQASGF